MTEAGDSSGDGVYQLVSGFARENGWEVKLGNAASVTALVQAGPRIVVSAAATLSLDEWRSLAREHTHIYFIVLDGSPSAAETMPANLLVIGGLEDRHDQAGFLAGMAAGFATETQRVAAFTLPTTPEGLKYRNGFVSGVRYACPKCRIDLVDLPDSQSALFAGDEAVKYVALGADVVFAKADEAGGVALFAAADSGAWAIGSGRYPNDAPPPEAARLIASVYVEAEAALAEALRAYLAGQPRSGVEPLSLTNGGLGLTIYPNADAALSPLDRRDIEAARARLADGSLETGVDPVTGEER